MSMPSSALTLPNVLTRPSTSIADVIGRPPRREPVLPPSHGKPRMTDHPWSAPDRYMGPIGRAELIGRTPGGSEVGDRSERDAVAFALDPAGCHTRRIQLL